MSRVDDALLLRDTIQKIIGEKLQKDRPGSSYATVTGFNPVAGTISVRYPGDDIDIDIPAGSIYPSEPGQIVKIGGSGGAKIIEDVIGENLTTVEVRTAQETADGKNTVNYGDVPPSGTDHKEGDIWFDEGDSNMPNVWDGTEWKSVKDLRVDAVKTAVDDLRTDLDAVVVGAGGMKTFYQPTMPLTTGDPAPAEGDLWFNTAADANKELHIFTGGAWVSAADSRISAVKAAQDALRADLDDVIENGSGTNTHYTPIMPPPASSEEGDLWFDPSDKNRPYIYQDGAWITVRDSYSKTSVGEEQFGFEYAGIRPDIIAGQNTSLPGFAFTGEAEVGTVATVPSGDGTGTARLVVPLLGEVTVDGTTVSAGESYAAGLPLGFDTTVGLKDGIKFKSVGGAPEAIFHMRLRVADQDLTIPLPMDVVPFTFGGKTHEAYFSEMAQFYGSIYGAQATIDFAIEFKVPNKAGNFIEAPYIIAMTQVTAPGIADSAITETKILDDAISTPKLQAGSIVAGKIASNAIETDHLNSKVITTDKLAVGAITAESGVVGSLDAGKITVGTLAAARIAANSITADKVLIGSDRNGVPNGELTAGDASGWPGGFTYQTTDTPPTYSAAANLTGTTSRSWSSAMPLIPVTPGDTIIFEAWVKADKPNARIFQEVIDQANAHLGRAGYGWTSLEGSAAAAVYPVSSWIAPTTWTKVVSRITIAPGVTGIRFRNSIPNHSSGSERTATFSYTGMKLYRQIGSTLIEPGAITTEKIAVGAITAESGIIGSLDAGKITVGTLDAARIAAGSITADKVLLGDTGNVFNDPNLVFAGGYGLTFSVVSGGLEATGTGAQRGTYQAHTEFSVMPGERIYASATRTTLAGSATGEVTIYLQQYNPTNGIWSGPQKAVIMTADGSSSGEVVAAATVSKMRIGTYLQSTVASGIKVRITDILIRRMTGSTLIEPGAITTEKIAVGAITAESAIIASIDAAKITVGTLSGARLAADAIDGKRIIGATIATSLGFPRVQMDTAGLAIYKSSAVRSFFADATTGDLSIVGDFSTASSGPRVEIKNSAWTNIEVVDPGGNSRTVNGSGLRIGSDSTYGFDIYHGAYTSSDSGGTIVGQSAMIAGPRKRAIIALAESGDIMIQSRELSGKRKASIGASDTGQAHIIAYNAQEVDVARVFVGGNGSAGMQSSNASGVSASEIVSSNTYAGLAFSPGKTDQQALFVDKNGIKFEADQIRGFPAIYGTFSSGAVVANTPRAVAVTFPAGAFNNVPAVVISPSTSVPGTTVLGTSVAAVSKTGFTAYVTRTNTTATTLSFIALGV